MAHFVLVPDIRHGMSCSVARDLICAQGPTEDSLGLLFANSVDATLAIRPPGSRVCKPHTVYGTVGPCIIVRAPTHKW